MLTAIFIADENARIYDFNDSFRTLFHKPEDQILKQLCGNVMGCIFTVEEGRDCGATSNCESCALRTNIIKSFTDKVPVYKEEMERSFVINGETIKKYFIFTTKYLVYSGREMILVIVDDITELEEKKQRIERHYISLFRELNQRIEEYSSLREQLYAAEDEKQVLRHELNHRIGNNLQIISSLMNLHIEDIQDEKVRDYCLQILNRVQVIKTLYQHLINEKNNLVRVELDRYIESLLDTLNAHAVKQGKSLEFSLQIAKHSTSIDIALPLGLIIHEFISTEISKDAFSGKAMLSLEVKPLAYPIITIAYLEKSTAADEHKPEELSLTLVKLLSEQLEATCTLSPLRNGSSGGISSLEIQL